MRVYCTGELKWRLGSSRTKRKQGLLDGKETPLKKCLMFEEKNTKI